MLPVWLITTLPLWLVVFIILYAVAALYVAISIERYVNSSQGHSLLARGFFVICG